MTAFGAPEQYYGVDVVSRGSDLDGWEASVWELRTPGRELLRMVKDENGDLSVAILVDGLEAGMVDHLTGLAEAALAAY